jgi:hypothetical protein
MESTRRPFYCLRKPSDGKSHQVYGQPEWDRRFGRADWSEKAGGFSTGRLLRPYGKPPTNLSIILPSPRVGDFVWTWYGDCIVTEGTLSLFREAGFTGFEPRPVIVEKIKSLSRKRSEEVTLPPLWELPITGKGGDAAPESGIYVLYQIEDTGTLSYSSFRNGIVVDEAHWDGSDFFTINGYPKHILVTEQVKEFIIAHQLTNCALIPSDKLEWTSGARPEDLLAKTREMAARPLESLLADLEDPDLCKDAIYALGEKGDPRAVDPLIRTFDNPSPFVWDAAASSVAEIAKHKETPEQTRMEIFSKLVTLLGHEDPLMRKSAATTFGRIGGERAAQEVMKLHDDPDESVRSTAVFVMGLLRYRPALQAVKRLTRDRSKRVREMARRMVSELSSEFP